MCNDFRLLARNFIGHYKANSYDELVANLRTVMSEIGLLYVFKDHFLDYHQDVFPENCGALTKEHGECVHYDISAVQTTNQGKWSARMMADLYQEILPGCCKLADQEAAQLIKASQSVSLRNVYIVCVRVCVCECVCVYVCV